MAASSTGHLEQSFGEPALLAAVAAGSTLSARMLLAAGATPSTTARHAGGGFGGAQQQLNQSSLHLAASMGKVEMVQLMGQQGGDPWAQTPTSGQTAFDLAADDRTRKALRIHIGAGSGALQQKAGTEQGTGKGGAEKGNVGLETALVAAAGHGNLAETVGLLRKGVDTELHDQNGCTALHLASVHGFRLVAKTLLQFGACAKARTAGEGDTPLHFATFANHIGVVEALLRFSADPTAKNREGLTPFDLANTVEINALLCRGKRSVAQGRKGAPNRRSRRSGSTGGKKMLTSAQRKKRAGRGKLAPEKGEEKSHRSSSSSEFSKHLAAAEVEQQLLGDLLAAGAAVATTAGHESGTPMHFARPSAMWGELGQYRTA